MYSTQHTPHHTKHEKHLVWSQISEIQAKQQRRHCKNCVRSVIAHISQTNTKHHHSTQTCDHQVSFVSGLRCPMTGNECELAPTDRLSSNTCEQQCNQFVEIRSTRQSVCLRIYHTQKSRYLHIITHTNTCMYQIDIVFSVCIQSSSKHKYTHKHTQIFTPFWWCRECNRSSCPIQTIFVRSFLLGGWIRIRSEIHMRSIFA